MMETLRTPAFIGRFWSRVEKLGNEGGCWLFIGAEQGTGYGIFFPQKGMGVLAHRFSAVIAGMKVGPEDQVLHKCDVRCCVNPAHLFVGTHRDNMDDRNRKQRQMRGVKHPLAKLTDEKAKEIKRRLAKGDSERSIARDFGVSPSLIHGIANFTHWKHVK